MKIVWALLCEGFVQDKTTNMLSVFNVIDEMRFLAAPPESEPGEVAGMIPYQFRLLASIARSAPSLQERGNARVTIISPDGLEHRRADVEVNLEDFGAYRVWFNFSGLPVSSAGTYRFLLDCKTADGEWGKPFEVPVLVILGPAPGI